VDVLGRRGSNPRPSRLHRRGANRPYKVDACLRNSDGRRQNVNICLVDDMVPDRNIRLLNDCVNAAEHDRNDWYITRDLTARSELNALPKTINFGNVLLLKFIKRKSPSFSPSA
jgi:hypothetical protein